MGDIVYLDHRSFRRVKAVAAKQNVKATTSREVQRADKGLSRGTTAFTADNHYSQDMDDAFEVQGALDQAHLEIVEEIEAERDDWARSNEDGWFYCDDGGN